MSPEFGEISDPDFRGRRGRHTYFGGLHLKK
jgi:hypothetical protein